MKKLLSFAAFVAAISAVSLRAEERVWRFKPGQTWKYECRSRFAFGSEFAGGDTKADAPGWDGAGLPPTIGGGGSTVPGDPRDSAGRPGGNGGGTGGGPGDPRDGKGGGQGGATTGGSDMPGDPRDRESKGDSGPKDTDNGAGGGKSDGGKPAGDGDGSSREGGKDTPPPKVPGDTPTDPGGAKPGDEETDSSDWGVSGSIEQDEVVQITAVVLAVGDEGNARVRLTVDSVRVEIRSGETGIRLTYNSATEPSTDYAGFKPFQALPGHSWTVLIDADGVVGELEGEAWPAPEAAPKPKKGDEKKAEVAKAAMPPTAARAWVNMIFVTTPPAVKAVTRTLNLGVRDETLELTPVRDEVANGHVCLRTDLKTKARFLQLGGAPPPNASPARKAHRAAQIAEKRGLSWFTRKSLCTMRAVLRGRGQDEVGGTVDSGDLALSVELKHIGTTDLTPGGGQTESGK